MSEITRYRLHSTDKVLMEAPDSDGPYVRYSDIQPIQAALTQAEATIAGLTADRDLWRDAADFKADESFVALTAERDAARLQLAAAQEQCGKLEAALVNIVESRDMAAELYTSDIDMANSFADKARAAIAANTKGE